MKAKIYHRADGLWGVRLVGENGEKMSSFEGYVSKANAERAIMDVWQAFAEGEVDIEVEDGQESEARHGETVPLVEGEASS